MNISPSFVAAWTPRIHGVLRIVTGLLFLMHGTKKLFGVPGLGMSDAVQLFSLMGFAGVLELVGGVLLLVGMFTRPTAFILSGMMAVAYFTAHAPKASLPILNQGELAVMFCFVCLYLSVAGAGGFSVDAERGKA